MEIRIKPRVKKYIETLPKKHKRQVKDYLLALLDNPKPADVKALKNYAPYVRGDIGEYRIIYRHDSNKNSLTIVLLGKRNDGDVYKQMRRLFD